MSNYVYNDNNVVYGSSRASDITNAGTYVCENISLSFPTRSLEKQDQVGNPSGFVLANAQPTGTTTMQVSTAGTYPSLGDKLSFLDITVPAAGSHPWVISQLGTPFEQFGIQKINVSLMLALFS